MQDAIQFGVYLQIVTSKLSQGNLFLIKESIGKTCSSADNFLKINLVDTPHCSKNVLHR